MKTKTRKKKGESRTVKGNLAQYSNGRPRVYTGSPRGRRQAADLTATQPMTVTERATDNGAPPHQGQKGAEATPDASRIDDAVFTRNLCCDNLNVNTSSTRIVGRINYTLILFL